MKAGGIVDQFRNPDFRVYHNISEVSRLLNGKPYRQAENALRAALREAANIVKVAAKRKVRVDTGALKKSIAVKVSAIPGGAFARIGVVEDRRWTFTRKAAQRHERYGQGVLGRRLKKHEYDSKPDKIVKRPMMYGAVIEKDYPFLKPSIMQNRETIKNVIVRRVREEMRKPWDKTSKRARTWKSRRA